MQKRTEITVERTLNEEKPIAFSKIGELFTSDGTFIPPEQLPESVQRAIASLKIREQYDKDGNKTITYEYKFWDKGKALERLERHLGMYNDRLQITFDEGLQQVIDALPEEIREQVIAKITEMHSKGKGGKS